jgi:hypothetical protein
MTISARNNNIIVWFAKENYLEVPYCFYVKPITDIYSVIIFLIYCHNYSTMTKH